MGEAILKKPIEASKEMKKIMAQHFYELDDASKTKKRKVAWFTSVGPAELLRAMGQHPLQFTPIERSSPDDPFDSMARASTGTECRSGEN